MSKTPVHKRLVVWVDDAWSARPAIAALTEKGHHVVRLSDVDTWGMVSSLAALGLEQPDLILSKAAHMWSDEMFEKPAFLELALKVARARKKGKPNDEEE